MVMSSLSITTQFCVLKDPRLRGKCQHRLLDIVVVAVCAVIAGCDTWDQIELFGKRHHDWLKRFLILPYGIPSHDTFERVFDRINPLDFQLCFTRWTQALCRELGLNHIAIDGKTLRSSGNSTTNLAALHLVSAWATDQKLTLGQVAVDSKSNEITAIPALLDFLDVKGAFVSIDAMGCQKAIAEKIVDKGGDYILTVKENQPNLLADIKQAFEDAINTDFRDLQWDSYTTRERGHGREEFRAYTVIHSTAGIRNSENWKGLTTIGMCYSERTIQGKTSAETRFFIGSRKVGAKEYASFSHH